MAPTTIPAIGPAPREVVGTCWIGTAGLRVAVPVARMVVWATVMVWRVVPVERTLRMGIMDWVVNSERETVGEVVVPPPTENVVVPSAPPPPPPVSDDALAGLFALILGIGLSCGAEGENASVVGFAAGLDCA